MRTENGILARIKNREAGELEKIQKKGNSLPTQKNSRGTRELEQQDKQERNDPI